MLRLQDLRLVEHSHELAALVQQSSTAHARFMDFVPLEESVRVKELLHRFDGYPPESINTQTFLTRLMDIRSNFRAEVFQVTYRKNHGRKIRHLVGLRESGQRSPGSPVASATLDSENRQSSYAMLSPGIFTPNSDLMEPPQKAEPAIEHKRLLSLQIDMQRATIQAASKPGFTGRKLMEVFSESGLEVLERAWAEARLGDKAVSFRSLELRLSASVRDWVDGILEVATTDMGEQHLEMRCLLPPMLAGSLEALPSLPSLPRSNSRSLQGLQVLPRLSEAPAQEAPSQDVDAPEFVNVNF